MLQAKLSSGLTWFANESIACNDYSLDRSFKNAFQCLFILKMYHFG